MSKSIEIIEQLKSHANPENVAGMARFGITGKNVLGGPNIPTLRKMASVIKKSGADRHQIALELWDTEIHEARLLAGFIDDPKKLPKNKLKVGLKILILGISSTKFVRIFLIKQNLRIQR